MKDVKGSFFDEVIEEFKKLQNENAELWIETKEHHYYNTIDGKANEIPSK